jgi:heptaprenyl diphosphate synthase
LRDSWDHRTPLRCILSGSPRFLHLRLSIRCQLPPSAAARAAIPAKPDWERIDSGLTARPSSIRYTARISARRRVRRRHRGNELNTLPIPSELTSFSFRVSQRLIQLAGALPESLRDPVHRLAQRPGKGLRSLLLAACADFGPDGGIHSGGADDTRLVRVGALLEMLHLASLLHDDVVDQAPVRRGLPAAHVVVGTEQAMLAGLACFALAGTEAASIGGGLDVLVSRTVAGLAYGQLLDVERAFDTALAIADYVEMVERKTGDLFRLSCLLGAAAGGVEPGTGRALCTFGREFGVAFQILDDCLDLQHGDYGKSSGTDHLLGLFGAPTLCALSGDGADELAEVLLSPTFTRQEMPRVRELVVRLGGLTAAISLAREHYDTAVSALGGLDDGSRDALVAVASVAWQSLE